MTTRTPAANPTLHSILIGMGSFSTTILLILGANARGPGLIA